MIITVFDSEANFLDTLLDCKVNSSHDLLNPVIGYGVRIVRQLQHNSNLRHYILIIMETLPLASLHCVNFLKGPHYPQSKTMCFQKANGYSLRGSDFVVFISASFL